MYKFREGFYADIRIEDRYSTNISYMNEILRECKETYVKKAFIRVFDGQMWYFASTSELGQIQAELDALYANATFNKDIHNVKEIQLLEVNQEECLIFDDCSVRDVALSQKNSLVRSAIPHFKGAPHFRMLNSIYADRNVVYEFYSSKGAKLKHDFQMCTATYLCALGEGEVSINCLVKEFGTRYDELKVNEEKIKSSIDEYENYLINAKPCQKGEFPVVLSPEVTAVFAHESFGHNSEADGMMGDEKLRELWSLGKRVGSKILSIYDTGDVIGSGYVPFDHEGTRNKKVYLIKEGILKGRLHSSATAAAFNEGLTGNARALNADFEPIVRMRTTCIEAGDKTLDELLANIKFGYFIKTYKHGSGLSTFTIAPNTAYEIVDGKIGAPALVSVITGNVFTTLERIDGVSKEFEYSHSALGGCGKGEQNPLNVSDGGPYISISKMTVQ